MFDSDIDNAKKAREEESARRMIIAIDGPAASGKGTLARRLAEHFDLPHLDTGLLYRATAASLLHGDKSLHDVPAAIAAARGLSLTEFGEEQLRGREMGEAASIVAAMPEVRASLVRLQRDFAAKPGGAVLDGRDIGTVICPQADVKIFVTASAATRAQRRALELVAPRRQGRLRRRTAGHRQTRRTRRLTKRRAHGGRGGRRDARHDLSEYRRGLRGGCRRSSRV